MDTALRDKILGSLAGSAIGDAMGAATELLTEGEIIRRFGKPVDSFEVPPPGNPYAGGRDAGQLTDDSSLDAGLVPGLSGKPGCNDGGGRGSDHPALE